MFCAITPCYKFRSNTLIREHKMYSLAEYRGHFDSLDIWTNFSYKVTLIYLESQSLNHPTRFPQVGKTYESKDGTMVFKSDVEHCVGFKKTMEKESPLHLISARFLVPKTKWCGCLYSGFLFPVKEQVACMKDRIREQGCINPAFFV